MKSERGAKKRNLSDAKKTARKANSKAPLVVGGAIILSIIVGFAGGMLFFPKTDEAPEAEEQKTETKEKTTEAATTNSEWGDAYAEYFAQRDDLSESSMPSLSAVDFAKDGTPELILNYSTSVSAKTQIIYLDSEQKVQASDSYNNARLALLYPIEEIGEGDDAKPNLKPEPTWYLYNGSDTEYGRYAKVDDIIAGRSNPVFINAATDASLMSLHEQYIEISPELESFSLNTKKPYECMKGVVQSGEYAPINDNIAKSVSGEISDRYEVKQKEEEEKRAEEEKKKTEAEAERISAGIKAGDYTVAYGSYSAKLDGGDTIKIILKSDNTFTMEDTSTGDVKSGTFNVDGTIITLGAGSDSAKLTITGNNSLKYKSYSLSK